MTWISISIGVLMGLCGLEMFLIHRIVKNPYLSRLLLFIAGIFGVASILRISGRILDDVFAFNYPFLSISALYTFWVSFYLFFFFNRRRLQKMTPESRERVHRGLTDIGSEMRGMKNKLDSVLG
jgi:hypothetical protein